MKENLSPSLNPTFDSVHLSYNVFSDLCYFYKTKAIQLLDYTYLSNINNYLKTQNMNTEESQVLVACENIIYNC